MITPDEPAPKFKLSPSGMVLKYKAKLKALNAEADALWAENQKLRKVVRTLRNATEARRRNQIQKLQEEIATLKCASTAARNSFSPIFDWLEKCDLWSVRVETCELGGAELARLITWFLASSAEQASGVIEANSFFQPGRDVRSNTVCSEAGAAISAASVCSNGDLEELIKLIGLSTPSLKGNRKNLAVWMLDYLKRTLKRRQSKDDIRKTPLQHVLDPSAQYHPNYSAEFRDVLYAVITGSKL